MIQSPDFECSVCAHAPTPAHSAWRLEHITCLGLGTRREGKTTLNELWKQSQKAHSTSLPRFGVRGYGSDLVGGCPAGASIYVASITVSRRNCAIDTRRRNHFREGSPVVDFAGKLRSPFIFGEVETPGPAAFLTSAIEKLDNRAPESHDSGIGCLDEELVGKAPARTVISRPATVYALIRAGGFTTLTPRTAMNPCVAAKRIANSLHSQQLQTLRGVTLLSDSAAAVVFGNDDYAHDPETREEVRLLLERAAADQVEVLGFETDDAKHSTWAMVLRSTDMEWLRARLREASYQSHCENAALVAGKLLEAVSADTGLTEPEIVVIDDDACLVEGEDRSS
jgi:hypothetical protein